MKPNKDEIEKQRTKKTVHINSITSGVVKKEKPFNNESKKHNESNSRFIY